MFLYKSTRQVLAEGSRKLETRFMELACRFRSEQHPQPKINDLVTFVTIASMEVVRVYVVSAQKCQYVKEVRRPLYCRADKGGQARELENYYPSIDWGFARTPRISEKHFATLAVAWGPLV